MYIIHVTIKQEDTKMKCELHESIKLTQLIRKYGEARAEFAKLPTGNESANKWAESEVIFDEIKKIIGC